MELYKKIKKTLYIFLGFLFVALGGLGIILPVFPTTPFLLLASYFFAKGSDKFNNWFLSTNLYKKYLKDFVASRSMELKTKIKILLFASTMLLIAAYIVDIFAFRIFIALIFIYKYYYFAVKIKTIKSYQKKDGYFNKIS